MAHRSTTSRRPRAVRRARRRTISGVLFAVLAMAAGLLLQPVGPAAADAEGRTWVVNAVDDENGNRWESVDTDSSTVTIEVGDTVEWQFVWGIAGQAHDLTSQNSSTAWPTPVAVHRNPGDAPFSYTFDEPGVYDYICSTHGTVMTGTVVVVDPDSENQQPTVNAGADPASGAAPLAVHFMATATDPEGDPLSYQWDFGDAEDNSDQASGPHQNYVYETPGSYTATLEVTDGLSGVVTRTFPIEVDEPGTGSLPEVEASASPSSGQAPLEVEFSTKVRTSGEFHSFAHGLETYPDLTGTAELVRERGSTYAMLDVTGLASSALHAVHVHEEACASNNGGAHFRFDETQPFHEDNEIWLPFISEAGGASGKVEVTKELRAGPNAISIVIHDPENPALRIGCVDLEPSTADLEYAWEFGDGSTGEGPDPDHTYTHSGSHTATVTVSNTAGDSRTDSVEVTVGDAASTLPEVEALASPSSGDAPLEVGFSTKVWTQGEFHPFAHGAEAYPELAGSAELVRERGSTYAMLDVTGLASNALHAVHVHEEACASNSGGAHFRFDESKPFAEENEIWLPFTSSEGGASGRVEVTAALRAGPKAVSIVVHDPENPALRIGCVDLEPSTADLEYAWEFGDGETGEGPDPDHTYTHSGSHTATVTVSNAAGEETTSSVDVVVGDTIAPQTRLSAGPKGTVRAAKATFRFASNEAGSTFRCRLDAQAWRPCASPVTYRKLSQGAHRLRVRATDAAGNVDATPVQRRWVVDTRGPVVTGKRPGTTRDRTPRVRAVVRDRHSKVRAKDVTMRVDGRATPGLRYKPRTGKLAWTPRRKLAPGVHVVRLSVRDAVGNRTVTSWRFTVRR